MQTMMHDASQEVCKMMQIQEAYKYASDTSQEVCKYASRDSKIKHTHDSNMQQASDMYKGT